MTQFDQLLRQGLMDANRAEYADVLRQAEAMEPNFSPGYLRERMQMLADPWKWMRRRTRPRTRRGGIARSAAVAAAIAALLLATAAAAVSAPFWMAFFGGLDQRQQEIVDSMEAAGGEAKETAAESLLPPPVEHNGVTITPLRLLGAKNRLYLVLEIRAPEGTVFHPEDRYDIFGGLSRPVERRTEMAGYTSGFTVLEAGTTEPNVLMGVAEATASFDIGGCSYVVRALYRLPEDGEPETIFGGWDPETGPTESWEFFIPEDLNQDQLLEPPVEGVFLTTEKGTMTLISMSVSPLGIWWKYSFDGYDLGPHVRMALRMKDGTEVEPAPGQMTIADMGSGQTGTVNFERPVDLSQAAAVLWGDVEILLEQPDLEE